MKFCPLCKESDTYGSLWMLYCTECDSDLDGVIE